MGTEINEDRVNGLPQEIAAIEARLVPIGGSANQVLAKNSGNDGDVSWQTPAATGGGSDDGVIDGLALSIEGVTVTIGSGQWKVNGTQYQTNANTILPPLQAPDPTYDRIDVIYIVGNTFLVQQGTPSVNPIKPAIPTDNIEVGFAIIKASAAQIPGVSNGEMVVTQTPLGPQVNYGIAQAVVSSAALTGADWSTNVVIAAGLPPQKAFDSNYEYTCVAVNQWQRSVLNKKQIDRFLTQIDDSAGDQTSAQLQSAYPNAVPGQIAPGVKNTYEKINSTQWFKTPGSIA